MEGRGWEETGGDRRGHEGMGMGQEGMGMGQEGGKGREEGGGEREGTGEACMLRVQWSVEVALSTCKYGGDVVWQSLTILFLPPLPLSSRTTLRM